MPNSALYPRKEGDKMNADEEAEKERLLEYVAYKAAIRDGEFFLAAAVEAYQATHQLDRATMASWLGITSKELSLLSICGKPNKTDPEKYARDIATIAAKFQIEEAKLTTIIENL